MSEVIVIASLTAESGKEAEAEEALRSIIDPTHAESGCLLYALHRGLEEPSRFCFVERWASREDLDAHVDAPHMKEALAGLEDLFGENVEITLFEALPAGDVSKGSLAEGAA